MRVDDELSRPDAKPLSDGGYLALDDLLGLQRLVSKQGSTTRRGALHHRFAANKKKREVNADVRTIYIAGPDLAECV